MAGRYSGDKPYVSNVNVKVRSQTREKRKQIGRTEQIGATFFFSGMQCKIKSTVHNILGPGMPKANNNGSASLPTISGARSDFVANVSGHYVIGPAILLETPLFCAALWSLFKGNCPCFGFAGASSGLVKPVRPIFKTVGYLRCALDSKFTAEV